VTLVQSISSRTIEFGRRAAALETLAAFAFSLFVLPAATTGCGPGNVIAKNKSIADVDDQTTTCKVAKDPLNPMIVEWPATSKVSLDRASKSGLVVVSYAGCTLKILQGCQAKGSYTYTGVTPARDKIDIGSQDDLYARLPLGAVSLKGELAQGAKLQLDYIAVGQRVADDAPQGLEGNCEGATHYVRTITLGAYSLDRMAKAEAGAGVDFNGAGVGGERKEADERLNFSGDVDGCSSTSPSSEDQAESSGCGAPLQLDLAPLRFAEGGVVSAGFGQGLGQLSTGPGDTSGIDAVGAASLKDVDADYLELLQNAKRADRDPKVKPIDKANAWGRLADYEGNNPTKEVASERRDAWEKNAADLDKLKNQYIADKNKLDKLLKLDDDIVSKDKKKAYKEEFAQVYTPWEPQLELAFGQPIESPEATANGGKSPTQLGTFRLQAEGGFDAQKLEYETAVQSKNSADDPVYDNDDRFAGDAGSAGGFVGVALTLPQIPAPGFGLSAIARYVFGNEVSRVVAGAGMKILVDNPAGTSGLTIGGYVGYAKLLGVSGTGCALKSNDAGGVSSPDCLNQYQAIVDGSAGGVDARLEVGYEFIVARYLLLSLAGGLGYEFIPFDIDPDKHPLFVGGFDPMTRTAINGVVSDAVKGVSATLQAGIGLKL
jgi:hypothetical protein